MSGYGTAMRDTEGKVRLYYRGGGDIDPPEVSCVALSDDGVSFARPSLGLYKIRGTRRQQRRLHRRRPAVVRRKPQLRAVPRRQPRWAHQPRWKAVALKVDEDDQGERQRMLTVLGSPDGFRWKPLADKPVIRKGGFDSLNLAFFDTAKGEYACTSASATTACAPSRAGSGDFLSWTIDAPLAFRPPQDEQWYTNGVTSSPASPTSTSRCPCASCPGERPSVPPRGRPTACPTPF